MQSKKVAIAQDTMSEQMSDAVAINEIISMIENNEGNGVKSNTLFPDPDIYFSEVILRKADAKIPSALICESCHKSTYYPILLNPCSHRVCPRCYSKFTKCPVCNTPLLGAGLCPRGRIASAIVGAPDIHKIKELRKQTQEHIMIHKEQKDKDSKTENAKDVYHDLNCDLTPGEEIMACLSKRRKIAKLEQDRKLGVPANVGIAYSRVVDSSLEYANKDAATPIVNRISEWKNKWGTIIDSVMKNYSHVERDSVLKEAFRMAILSLNHKSDTTTNESPLVVASKLAEGFVKAQKTIKDGLAAIGQAQTPNDMMRPRINEIVNGEQFKNIVKRYVARKVFHEMQNPNIKRDMMCLDGVSNRCANFGDTQLERTVKAVSDSIGKCKKAAEDAEHQINKWKEEGDAEIERLSTGFKEYNEDYLERLIEHSCRHLKSSTERFSHKYVVVESAQSKYDKTHEDILRQMKELGARKETAEQRLEEAKAKLGKWKELYAEELEIHEKIGSREVSLTTEDFAVDCDENGFTSSKGPIFEFKTTEKGARDESSSDSSSSRADELTVSSLNKGPAKMEAHELSSGSESSYSSEPEPVVKQQSSSTEDESSSGSSSSESQEEETQQSEEDESYSGSDSGSGNDSGSGSESGSDSDSEGEEEEDETEYEESGETESSSGSSGSSSN